MKWGGELYATEIGQSPLDVVAWHGNYAPYKYDLRRFSPVGAILFDHPDPSIFTVLTAPSETPGTANIDFVIFPGALGGRGEHLPAALVPPQPDVGVHGADLRRLRRQARGLRAGRHLAPQPDAAARPDAPAFEHASNGELKPVKLSGTMAFMFETRFPQRVTAYAAGLPSCRTNYIDCWAGLQKHFDPNRREPRIAPHAGVVLG